MSRNYNEYPSLRWVAGLIAREVIEQGSSSYWCGSIEDVDGFDALLSPFNIFYVDDMIGEWKYRAPTSGQSKC